MIHELGKKDVRINIRKELKQNTFKNNSSKLHNPGFLFQSSLGLLGEEGDRGKGQGAHLGGS